MTWALTVSLFCFVLVVKQFWRSAVFGSPGSYWSSRPKDHRSCLKVRPSSVHVCKVFVCVYVCMFWSVCDLLTSATSLASSPLSWGEMWDEEFWWLWKWGMGDVSLAGIKESVTKQRHIFILRFTCLWLCPFWLELKKITGLDDDWLRRLLLIARHFVSDSRDVIYMEVDRTATWYSVHEKRLHTIAVCVNNTDECLLGIFFKCVQQWMEVLECSRWTFYFQAGAWLVIIYAPVLLWVVSVDLPVVFNDNIFVWKQY